MKCPSKDCTVPMVHRYGKFGGFWVCSQHGTISDKGMEILQSMDSSHGTLCHSSIERNEPVLLEVKKQTLEFGIQPTEIEEWIVDDEAAADYEEDHWMNVRPY